MSFLNDCKYNDDGICIDGQECKYNSISVRYAKCYVSKCTLTDCKHFRSGETPRNQCRVLIPNRQGHVQCSVCKLRKDGSRKLCTFYDKGGEV